jgi:hypothetical protein
MGRSLVGLRSDIGSGLFDHFASLKEGSAQIARIECWEVRCDIVDRVTLGKVLEQYLNRDARPTEDRATAEYAFMRDDNRRRSRLVLIQSSTSAEEPV